MSHTAMLVIALDRDVAGHVAVALRRHRAQLTKLGYAEPPGLAQLETLARSVTNSHQASPALTVPAITDTDTHERAYLTRHDISQRVGTSLATVDRWIASGALPSTKHGRTRRVSRDTLDQFLKAA